MQISDDYSNTPPEEIHVIVAHDQNLEVQEGSTAKVEPTRKRRKQRKSIRT